MGLTAEAYHIHGHLYIYRDPIPKLPIRLLEESERKVIGGLPAHLWIAGWYPLKYVSDKTLPEPPWKYRARNKLSSMAATMVVPPASDNVAWPDLKATSLRWKDWVLVPLWLIRLIGRIDHCLGKARDA